MKRALCITMVVTVAFLFAGSGVIAQQQAQEFFDKEVATQDGDELGTVERVILDSETGDAKYLILSRGGLLGGLLGNQARVTILREQVNQQGEELTANIDFSKVQQLVQQQDQQQGAEILDQVLGKEVTGNQGSSIGTIDNLFIGTNGEGYVILSGENDQQYPIPLSALQQGEQEEFKANLAQEDLQQAPSFQGDQNFPDLAHQNWQQEIRGYYSGQQDQSQMRQDEQRSEGTDVQVRQPAPDVTIEQDQPEVQVKQQEPEIIVRQEEPEVHVEQQEPEVEIRQPEPQVTVQQQEPEVTVQTPEPQVQVQQPEPDVQIEQQEPEVTVRQQEPQVNVERQGEPQVKVVEPGQQQTQDTGKLIGMNVQDNQGNNLGTVRDVMVTGEDQNYIIMSSTDDDKMYPIPMQQLQQTDQENLQASFDRQRLENAPSYSQRELDQMNEQQFESEVRGYYGTGQQQQQQE